MSQQPQNPPPQKDDDIRMRRKHSVRLWNPELEAEFRPIINSTPLGLTSKEQKGQYLLSKWEGLGHSGYSASELVLKAESMARIDAMMKSGESGTATISDDISHHSLSENLEFFEEMVRSIWAEDTSKVVNAAETDKRTTTMSDALGRTALHFAADLGNLIMARSFVQNGASVNAADNEGNTPLFYALRHGRSDVVEYLLQRGADPKRVNKQNQSTLHVACHANDEASVRRLLAAGVPVGVQDHLKQTPLHVASHRSTMAICDLLIQHGASADVRDARGNAPANLARRMSKQANEKYLLQKMKTAITAVRAAVRLVKLGMGGPGSPKKTPTETK